MKKLFLIIMLLLSVSVFAQSDCVKFLGIPVDGTKEEMIRQLQQKGYVLKNYDGTDFLEGEFNGSDAHIFINTTKGKVDRVYVAFQNLYNETDIRIQFNNLLDSFDKSEKYATSPYKMNEHITAGEDISYEMTVNHKQYSALFHQKFTDKELSDFTQYLQENFDEVEANLKENRTETTDLIIYNDTLTREQKADYLATVYYITNSLQNQVWFTIEKASYNKFYIALFYDNLFNRPKGDDL